MLQRAHRPDRRRAAWVALTALIGVIALLSTGLMSAASARSIKVDQRIFGLHDSSDTSLTRSGVSSVRLWDTGTTWSDIDDGVDILGNTVYDFTRLDALVSAARSRGAEVTLVLGITPRRFSSDPTRLPASKIPAFAAYVRAVMERYGDRIKAYQVWNEPNVVDYWTGSISEMAQLTKIVWDARNRTGSHALVVSPALTTRLITQRNWIGRYAGQEVGGKPVYKYLDAVGLNLYPMPTYGNRPGVPENSLLLLKKTKLLLAAKNWPSLPIWNTEINYGIQSGAVHGASKPVSNGVQVANVLRTYLLNAASNVKRVFWYRWDMSKLKKGGTLGNTLLTETYDHKTLTKAGKSYKLAEEWLDGTLIGNAPGEKPCGADKHGTYTCTVRYSSGIGRIYWNPTKTVKVSVVKSAKKVQDEYGHTSTIKGGATHKVSFQPILVRSST